MPFIGTPKMTRHLLLAVIIGLQTLPLAAQESSARLGDQSNSAIARVLTPNTAEAQGADAFDLAMALQETPNDDALSSGASDSTTSTELGFHSVWDFDCAIPPLGDWCDCSEPCGVTDCWVDYPCQCSHGNCYLTEEGMWVSNDLWCDVWGTDVYHPNSALRFGWWAVDSSGSPVKVGEFQDLERRRDFQRRRSDIGYLALRFGQ